jgi:hypothetical protein
MLVTRYSIDRPGPISEDDARNYVPELQAIPPAPAIPYAIDDNSRVIVLNQLATYANALNTYWVGGFTPVGVLDLSASYPLSQMTSRVNDIIGMMASLVAKFPGNFSSITPMKAYTSLDYNHFITVISKITAQMNAMVAAKP